MHKLALIALLFFSVLAFSEDKYNTNNPEVFIKNFNCSGGKASFNVVNKSNRKIYFVYLNNFDNDGDPINKIYISGSIDPNSGKEDSAYTDCSKLKRIGFSVQ
jgi:hypothetical protein